MYIEVQSVSEPVDLRPRFGDKLQPKQELDMDTVPKQIVKAFGPGFELRMGCCSMYWFIR